MTAVPAIGGHVDIKVTRAMARVVGLASVSGEDVQERMRELTEVENAIHDSGEFAALGRAMRAALLVTWDAVREVVRILHRTYGLLGDSPRSSSWQQPLHNAAAEAATAGSSLHAAIHALAPLTSGTRKPETFSTDTAAAAASMVRRFITTAQEALANLILHLEWSVGADREDLCSVIPIRFGTAL